MPKTMTFLVYGPEDLVELRSGPGSRIRHFDLWKIFYSCSWAGLAARGAELFPGKD